MGKSPTNKEKTGAGKRLRELREQAGLSRDGLARLAGTSAGQIQKLELEERKLTIQWMARLAPHLNATTADFLPRSPAAKAQRGGGEDALYETQRGFRQEPAELPETIPILGTAEGGEDGWSLFNGEVIGEIARPPALAGVAKAYALYVRGESMEPRYHPGEIIFIHPSKPSPRGTYVLVQARPRTEGDPPRAIVKRMVKDLETKLVLEQLNPPRQFEVPRRDIVCIHRIVGSEE